MYLVSSSPLPPDVEPFFQLFSKNGQRLLNMEYLLSELNDQQDFLVLSDSIILVTPSQPNLDVILNNDWVIKLAVRRQSDGEESKMSFEFCYSEHHLDNDNLCIFCDLNLD